MHTHMHIIVHVYSYNTKYVVCTRTVIHVGVDLAIIVWGEFRVRSVNVMFYCGVFVDFDGWFRVDDNDCNID